MPNLRRFNTRMTVTFAGVLAMCACQPSGLEQSARVLGAEQTTIAYQAAGAGETTLIFIHGWSCDRSYWREQLPMFAEHYKVVALDLGGHGESGAERNDYTMASFGQDVAAVADALDAHRIVLIGHSMGGPVALEASQILGERVVGIVGVDTLKDIDRPAPPPEVAKQMLAGLQEDFVSSIDSLVRNSFFHPDSPPEMIDAIAADMAAGNAAVGFSAVGAYLKYDFGGGVAQVAATPLVLINGDYQAADREALAARHPGASVVIIEHSGHFPMLEQPEAFNQSLRRVIEGLLPDS